MSEPSEVIVENLVFAGFASPREPQTAPPLKIGDP